MIRREVQALPTRLVKVPEPTEQETETAAAKPAWAWRGTPKTQRSCGSQVVMSSLAGSHCQCRGYDSDSEMAYQKYQEHKSSKYQGSY